MVCFNLKIVKENGRIQVIASVMGLHFFWQTLLSLLAAFILSEFCRVNAHEIHRSQGSPNMAVVH